MQYLLDLETLLLFLSKQNQSGELTAELKRFPGIAYKKSCQVQLLLAGGKILSCSVRDYVGTPLVEGEAALDGLFKMGQIAWSWSAKEPTTGVARLASPPVPARRHTSVLQLIPRRLVSLDMVNRAALPRKSWQVLLLIDGSRTVSQLATLFTRSPSSADLQELLRVLSELEQQGIIALMSG